MSGTTKNSNAADNEPQCVGFAHPRLEEHEEVKKSLLRALQPYAVHTALAPNFDAQPESASAFLHRAFDVSAQFNDARVRAGAAAAAAAAADSGTETAKPVPRGYAIKVDGSMPIDSEERLRHTLAKWDQGLGTSMYAVKSLPDALKRGASDDAIGKLNADAQDSLPDIISPSHRVVLARTSNAFDDDEYALFVTANDVAAARRLYQYTAARAASDTPVTVATLASSDEYQLLHTLSQAARNELAQQYAGALGVEIEAEPLRNTTHYSIVSANRLAHGTFASRLPQSGAREPEHYTIYNAASPTYEADQDTGVLLSHGVMGGVTLLTQADADDNWHQPQFLSLIPQDSAAAHDEHTQIAATHRKESDRSLQAFQSRVAWRSDYENTLHVNSNERFYALSDPYSKRWLDKLSPTHSSAPVAQRHYTMVSAQLPSISTIYASPAALGALARTVGGPSQIAVALDNPLVQRIPLLWDPVVRPSDYNVELRNVFANAYEEPQDYGFRTLMRQTTSRNEHFIQLASSPSLYADADRYNVSPSTGLYRSQYNTDDTEQLRNRLATDMRSYTVLSLDKDLIRLITD
jgi:hypothetical protein